MPVARDDTDRDLPLALGQRVATGLKMNAESADDLCELWIMNPNLNWARQAPARLNDGVIGILLFSGHLVVGYLGVASEGRVFRCHFFPPVSSLFCADRTFHHRSHDKAIAAPAAAWQSLDIQTRSTESKPSEQTVVLAALSDRKRALPPKSSSSPLVYSC